MVDFGRGRVHGNTNKIEYDCKVTERSYEDFHDGNQVACVDHVQYKPYSNEEAVARSKRAVGSVRVYNRFFYNCEHFANQIKIGKAISYQIVSICFFASSINHHQILNDTQNGSNMKAKAKCNRQMSNKAHLRRQDVLLNQCSNYQR